MESQVSARVIAPVTRDREASVPSLAAMKLLHRLGHDVDKKKMDAERVELESPVQPNYCLFFPKRLST